MLRRLLALGTLSLISFAIPGTVRAEGVEYVTVGFGVAAAARHMPPQSVTPGVCQLQVRAGANGISVLSAAVAKGCIVSYRLSQEYYYDSPGVYKWYYKIDCVNEVCNNLIPRNCDLDGPYGYQICIPRPSVTWEVSSGILASFVASNGANLIAYYNANAHLD